MSYSDLHEGILEIFAEAQTYGRKRDLWRGLPFKTWHLDSKTAPLPHSPSITQLGLFVVALPLYPMHRPVTITRPPCHMEHRTCPTCGGIIEWREGLTERQSPHLNGRHGQCPGAPARKVV